MLSKHTMIDMQAHFMPQGYIQRMEERTEWPCIRRNGESYYFQYGPTSAYTISKSAYDIGAVLAAMDETGIDTQALSINIPGAEILDIPNSVDIARMVNDEYAQIVSKHSNRFVAFATLPLRDTDASLKETERAVKQLGFRGLMFFSNVMGLPLSDKRFWPIYELAQELNKPIYIHPTRPVMADQVSEYGLEMIVGYLFDTSLAVLKLIFSGVLEQYPELKIIMPHAGGTLPYLLNRIDYQSVNIPGSRKNLCKAPSEYIKKIYMDTVCLSTETLRLAYDLVGADHILFATDYPFVGMQQTIDVIEHMDISNENKQLIFCGNAKRLLKI